MNSEPCPVDVLAVGIHPDDVELSCAGTLLKMASQGKTFGILDLSEGEMGTRGNARIRREEAKKAAAILGAKFRIILDIPDCKFEVHTAHIEKVMWVIRACRPQAVLCNAPSDRHPDHGKAAELVKQACFYSGLPKWKTKFQNKTQDSHRPIAVYHYIQDYHHVPHFVVDVTEFAKKKFEAIQAFKSQFYDPKSAEPETPISRKDFMDYVSAKMLVYGRYIGAEFGEGFLTNRPLGVRNILDLD
ncbi:MAG: bacillithiol biosynthesis deacetylase BshB1 [Bacteroidia bacterium]|nr:bacillithiol biosynthesis deacetylase BshB1 [Bacteroidia bacterium]